MAVSELPLKPNTDHQHDGPCPMAAPGTVEDQELCRAQLKNFVRPLVKKILRVAPRLWFAIMGNPAACFHTCTSTGRMILTLVPRGLLPEAVAIIQQTM